MEVATKIEIRDFRIRGNYSNPRTLLFRRQLHSSKGQGAVPKCPGYSPPVVEVELLDGTTCSTAVSECDVPLLSDDDFDKAKRNLSLILEARQGQPAAIKELSAAAQKYMHEGTEQPQPSEIRFVVPCTSSKSFTEHAISH